MAFSCVHHQSPRVLVWRHPETRSVSRLQRGSTASAHSTRSCDRSMRITRCETWLSCLHSVGILVSQGRVYLVMLPLAFKSTALAELRPEPLPRISHHSCSTIHVRRNSTASIDLLSVAESAHGSEVFQVIRDVPRLRRSHLKHMQRPIRTCHGALCTPRRSTLTPVCIESVQVCESLGLESLCDSRQHDYPQCAYGR